MQPFNRLACASVLAILTLPLGCSSSSPSASTDGGPVGDDAGGPSPSTDASVADSSSTSDGATLPDDGATEDSSPTPPSGDGGAPDAFAPVADGGAFVQFVTGDETAFFDKSQEEKTTGTITFGAPNAAASDNAVGNLTRTGGQATIGTSGAEEIVSAPMLSYGTYRFRFSLASCASTEEAVNGIFSYFNDGTKASDGLVINREVDIEILCGEPWLINLTIWTEFTDDAHLKNQARVLDTRTGTLYVYANDTEGDQTGTESHPELVVPNFPQAGAFYEMGWTWAADHLEYFIVVNGTQLTLWNATDATRIPQLPMNQHFNLWAPGEHWSTGDKATAPANAATLALDWFRFDPQ